MKNILTFELFEYSQFDVDSIKKEIKIMKSFSIKDDPGYNDLDNNLKSFLIGKTLTYYATKEEMDSKTNPMSIEIKDVKFICQDPMSPAAQSGRKSGNKLVLSSSKDLEDSYNVDLTMYSPNAIDLDHKKQRNLSYTDPETQMDYFSSKYIKTKEEPKGAPFGIVYSPNLYKALQNNPNTKNWINYEVSLNSNAKSDF